MSTLLIPVVNGILPRPGGGRSAGGFVEGPPDCTPKFESGVNVFICPMLPSTGALYRVGVLAKVLDVGSQKIEIAGHDSVRFVSLLIEGSVHARWKTLSMRQGYVMAEGLEAMDFRGMRAEYPVVSGAGWVPQGGCTEFRSPGDIPVTLYGSDIERGTRVSLQGNLKGLIELESAHTVEHAMIRSLHTYGLCTALTLQQAMREETEELSWSVEKSMRFAMPEVLGATQSGACGNPMTNLAQFYMFQELSEQLKGSEDGTIAMDRARRRVMSQLTSDLGLTTEPGLRVFQALKKGMKHDDSPLGLELCKKILQRFPMEPW